MNAGDRNVAAADVIVSTRGLGKIYQDGLRQHTVLHDVNLDITRGEFLVLMGRSGSGKSTLLHLLSGIDVPGSGSIHIDGERIDTLSEKRRTLFRRRHIGLVFQFFNLIPALTVLENVLLPLELNAGLDVGGRDYAHGLLERVGLERFAHRFPEQLSGGEQQRVAIVRALAHRPRLVLADEPTGNLDDDTGAEVMQLFTQLQRDLAMTLVMVTHSQAVAGMAQRRLVLGEGTLQC